MREQLQRLVAALEQCRESTFVELTNKALQGSDAELSTFLISNELWGGAGSIADQAGLNANGRTERRRIERLLAELGETQMRAGKVNVRTSMWVEAFRKWEREGI